MTDNSLRATIDPHVAPGTYVKIQAAKSKYRGLYGWVGETWNHNGKWYVAVHDRCDLRGYYQWFALGEVWLASAEQDAHEEWREAHREEIRRRFIPRSKRRE